MKSLLFSVGMMFAMIAAVPSAGAQDNPFAAGETIRYTIRKMGLPAGQASLTFEGLSRLADGRETLLIVFAVQAVNVEDEERIFVDPQSFLPVQVERRLNIWGKREQIVEFYDHAAGQVRIVKNAGGRETEEIIEKTGRLENIYGFIYRYRSRGGFTVGQTMEMSLPTKDLTFRLKEKASLKAAGQVFDAYMLQSEPRQYTVWFSESDSRIPLRIDGAIGFGNMSMVMRDYRPAAVQQAKR